MAMSMTGFGRAEKQAAGRNITVEIKAVNHRYFECSVRLPRTYSYMEDAVKKQVAAKVSRGKIEVYIAVQNLTVSDVQITPNLPLAREYYAAMQVIAQDLEIDGEVDINSLSRHGEIFTQEKLTGLQEETQKNITDTLCEALNEFCAMRAREGEKLKSDILARLETIEATLVTLSEMTAGRTGRYMEKLYARLQDLLAATTIDEARVLQEAAIYADKTAVDEELVRLESHISQYRDILGEEGSVGKKLDFLTQELNRETNTIGSKASDVDITRLVVDLKAEIEKIREQVQNIE